MESYIHLYKTNDEFTEAYNSPNYKEPWLSLTEDTMTIGYSKPKLTAITFDSITWVTDVPAKGGTATKDNCTFKVYAKYDNGISVDISSDAIVTGELVVPSSTEGQRHEAGKLTLTASYSGLTATGNVTVYQEAVPDFSTKPLTFNILSAGTINWTASNSSVSRTIEYKLNNNEWTSITSNKGSSAPTITVNPGDKIQFKGNNKQYYDSSADGYNSFSGSTALFEAEGNIMSLIYGDDFKNNSTISSTYAFAGLFKGCVNLVSAKNLILSATTLASSCYYQMFESCTSLTTAPELPTTTLADSCYSNMFYGCTSLTTAPELPATTLADSCYSNMFYGTNVLPDCSNIDFASSTVVASGGLKDLFSGTKVTDNDLERLLPKNDNGRYYLPATTLANYCYSNMFNNCTSLKTAPALPATTLARGCYNSMFYKCTSLTTAPALPATTLANYCYDYMFYNCTSLTTAPELPATTLANYCYECMFQNCTSLTTAPALPATTLANDCYSNMFQDCKSLKTAPELPATTLASSCYQQMFLGCTSLTTAPELPATTLANYCYSNMFQDCKSLKTAPELPATTLANYCYRSMFYGCTNLNYIKCLATDISATNCTYSWVNGVASTGTFVKASSMTSWATGTQGIPTRWTVQNA